MHCTCVLNEYMTKVHVFFCLHDMHRTYILIYSDFPAIYLEFSFIQNTRIETENMLKIQVSELFNALAYD